MGPALSRALQQTFTSGTCIQGLGFKNGNPMTLLTSRVSLLSPSEKSTGDMRGHVDNGLLWAGVGRAICWYDCDYGG